MVLQIKMFMALGQLYLVSYQASEGLQADSWRNSRILTANFWLKRTSSQAPRVDLQHPWKTELLWETSSQVPSQQHAAWSTSLHPPCPSALTVLLEFCKLNSTVGSLLTLLTSHGARQDVSFNSTSCPWFSLQPSDCHLLCLTFILLTDSPCDVPWLLHRPSCLLTLLPSAASILMAATC